MTIRRAACHCGRLALACEGEPARVSLCHCLECQRRTGSVFGAQAWFRRENVTFATGAAKEFTRISDAGNPLTFRFCEFCGSTVYWEAAKVPGLIAVAVGAFADPSFPAPQIAVWQERRHSWVDALSNPPIDRSNQ
jgi:hypothetical protein